MNNDAAGALNHVPKRGLGHQERAFQVDVELQVPLLFGAIDCGMGIKDAGIVEQNIELAESLDGAIDGALALVEAANVSGNENGFAATLQDALGYGLPAFFIAAGNRDAGAFLGEEDRRGLSDAGGSAGDESDFVG